MARGLNHAGFLALAMARLQAGAMADAEIALRRLVVFSPGFSRGYLAWGERVSRLGAYSRTARLLRIAEVTAPDDPRVHRNLAAVGSRRGDLEASRRHARRALVLAPEAAVAWRNLAGIESLSPFNNHQAAVRFLGWSRWIRPLRAPDQQILMHALYELDRLAGCVQVIRSYLVGVPGGLAGYRFLSRVFAKQARLEDADAQVDRMDVLQPGDIEVMHAKGRIALAARRYCQSARLLRQVLILRPERGAAVVDLSRALWNDEVFEQASRVMEMALCIDPKFGGKIEMLRRAVTNRDFLIPR
jgi:tetratricopeptide (TPR) repeat protein